MSAFSLRAQSGGTEALVRGNRLSSSPIAGSRCAHFWRIVGDAQAADGVCVKSMYAAVSMRVASPPLLAPLADTVGSSVGFYL
jgi:hypothetical protein